ncbi:hypothetical protein H5410_044238 [Solanum commersonii]|uniref:Uncharacterized protein n=1 Tax=Solanum commersonii TaxID=4109 RepID=A0A9J5X9B0_SOLCO|nr:hypothetical protein H5410_044238 [Solanum commersonii]
MFDNWKKRMLTCAPLETTREEALAKVSALELEISAAMPTNNEIPVKDASSQSKISQAKKTVSHANQKGKKRKVKIVEATHFVSDSDSDFVSEIKKKKESNKCQNWSVFKTNQQKEQQGKRTQKFQFQKKAKKWLG